MSVSSSYLRGSARFPPPPSLPPPSKLLMVLGMNVNRKGRKCYIWSPCQPPRAVHTIIHARDTSNERYAALAERERERMNPFWVTCLPRHGSFGIPNGRFRTSVRCRRAQTQALCLRIIPYNLHYPGRQLAKQLPVPPSPPNPLGCGVACEKDEIFFTPSHLPRTETGHHHHQPRYRRLRTWDNSAFAAVRRGKCAYKWIRFSVRHHAPKWRKGTKHKNVNKQTSSSNNNNNRNNHIPPTHHSAQRKATNRIRFLTTPRFRLCNGAAAKGEWKATKQNENKKTFSFYEWKTDESFGARTQ